MTIQNDHHLNDGDIKEILGEFRGMSFGATINVWLDQIDKKSDDVRKKYLEHVADFLRQRIIELDEKQTIGSFMDLNHVLVVHNIFNNKQWTAQEMSKHCYHYLNFVGFVGFILQTYIEKRLKEKVNQHEQI